jgi:gluconolactonase
VTHATALVPVLLLALGSTWLGAQGAGAAIERVDPALDAIVAADARLEIVKGDYFGMIGKPVWVPEGNSGHLLIGDPAANTIYKWSPGSELSVFLKPAAVTKDSNAGAHVNNGRLNVLAVGAWGLALDAQGRLVIAATGDRNVVRLEKDGTRTVLADRYAGKRFNSPLELVYRSDGALYISDGTAGLRGRHEDPEAEWRFQAMFLLKDGKVEILALDEGIGTGIALSPDEKSLYNAGNRVTRYNVRADGTIENGRVIMDWGEKRAGLPRIGVTTDQKGHVYATGPGGVWILTPEGKHLGTIRHPEGGANLAFGDADGKGLYIATRRSVYRVRMNVPGLRPHT